MNINPNATIDDIPREPTQATIVDVTWQPPHAIIVTLSDHTQNVWDGDYDCYEDIQRNLLRTDL